MQSLNARGHHDVAGLEPFRYANGRRIMAQQFDVAGGHGQALRVDDPDTGPAIELGEGGCRNLDGGDGVELHAPDHGGAESHRCGGSIQPDLDLECPGDGISLWGYLAHPAVAVTFGSSVRLTVMIGSLGADRRICAGTSNTASRPSCRATLMIHCPAWTTSPGSAPVAITMPSASRRSSV